MQVPGGQCTKDYKVGFWRRFDHVRLKKIFRIRCFRRVHCGWEFWDDCLVFTERWIPTTWQALEFYHLCTSQCYVDLFFMTRPVRRTSRSKSPTWWTCPGLRRPSTRLRWWLWGRKISRSCPSCCCGPFTWRWTERWTWSRKWTPVLISMLLILVRNNFKLTTDASMIESENELYFVFFIPKYIRLSSHSYYWFIETCEVL